MPTLFVDVVTFKDEWARLKHHNIRIILIGTVSSNHLSLGSHDHLNFTVCSSLSTVILAIHVFAIWVFLCLLHPLPASFPCNCYSPLTPSVLCLIFRYTLIHIVIFVAATFCVPHITVINVLDLLLVRYHGKQ